LKKNSRVYSRCYRADGKLPYKTTISIAFMPCLEYHYHMIRHMPLKESEVLTMPENNIQDRWISLQEVCDYPGMKRHTVMGWIDQRGMPVSKAGKLWRFKTADIDEGVKKGGASDEREVIK
jgi:excisionase family DNA binding protein